MPLITLTSPKGGTGRTTAAWLLCNELCERGHKVLYMPLNVFKAALEAFSDADLVCEFEPNGLRRHFRRTDLVVAVTHFDFRFGFFDRLIPWLREARRASAFVIVDGWWGDLDDFIDFPVISDLTLLCVGPSRLDAAYAKRFKDEIVRHAFEFELSTFNAKYLLSDTRGVPPQDRLEYLGLPRVEFMDQSIPHDPALAEMFADGSFGRIALSAPTYRAIKSAISRITDQVLTLIDSVDNVAAAARNPRYDELEEALSAAERKLIAKEATALWSGFAGADDSNA